MILKACDIATTIYQSFLFVWITNNIAYKYNKISRAKSLIAMILVFIEVYIFTHSNFHSSISNLLMVIGILLIVSIFFKKALIDAFLGFGVAYLIVAMTSYFLLTVYTSIAANLKLNISDEIRMLIFVFIPAWITYSLVYKNGKYIFNAAISLKNIRHLLIFVLIADYSILVIDTLRIDWTVESMGLMFKSVLYIITFISLIFTIIYFAKINNKTKEVEMLNNALNEKIVELKKIKHDYGSEISGLYGLYQLKQMDRLGLLLKSIVERYQNLNDGISVSEQATPMVASALYSATALGINVICFDSADYDNITINDNDFLKIISNIIRNSIDAVEKVKNPTIKYKSYNNHDGVVINISNNGPEIPSSVITKLYEAGFSTKENKNEYRGYGLSIVKDIISNCNGKISIESDMEWTTFQIEIPIKK